MNFSRKYLLIFITFLLLISLSANVYSFNKMTGKNDDNKRNIEKYISQINEKDAEIKELKKQITSSKNTEKTTNLDGENNSSTENIDGEVEQNNELINTAVRFIEYVFNSSPETYVTRKQNAHHYMTDEIIQTLFTSDGTDEVTINLRSTVKDIKVYLSETEDEALVYYSASRELLNVNVEEEKEYYVKLEFKTEDGVRKVSKIHTITVVGGV